MSDVTANHAGLMDGIYRHQRHIYDLSRKYYLLGRDRLLEDLNPPEGGRVLELGCGTGRNLVVAAQRYPGRAFFGVDISQEMLKSAGRSIEKAGLVGRVRLARADAVDFNPQAAFGVADFDKIILSFSVSMIPDWERLVANAFGHLASTGQLHLVDFGMSNGLPRFAKAALFRWLKAFHVEPRPNLEDVFLSTAQKHRARVKVKPLYRGYSVYAVADKSNAQL